MTLQTRYRFKVQPLIDHDATAILVFRDWIDDEALDFRVLSEVLSVDGSWLAVKPGIQLPMEHLPKITGYDMWYEQRMLVVLDQWEQHIRDAVKADTGVELRA